MALPSADLIITTYNWPEALNLVLQSVFQQTIQPNQILIADDGSVDTTRSLIESWEAKYPSLKHCWQQDLGFRAARSRNNALSQVNSDYVIFIDGDMLLEPHFIEDHISFARNGSFVQGRRAMSTAEATDHILKDQSWQWNRQQLSKQVKAPHKLKRIPLAAKILGYSQKNARDIRSCNMGFWMNDLVAVNGFDSDYIGWGREDSDLGYRLINYGIKKRHLRYGAVAIHLHHNEHSRDSLPENDLRLKKSIHNSDYIRCKNGIEQIKYNSP